MKKIVLIEDDCDLYSLLQYNLEKEGFQFAGSKTGKGATDLCHPSSDVPKANNTKSLSYQFTSTQIIPASTARPDMPIL